jgi:GTP cyclohydrolase II
VQTIPEVARVPIATSAGEFEVRAFDSPGGDVYLAMVRGDVADGGAVLVRLHSECLTGDVLGSRRCDCGVQLQQSMRIIAAEGRGVLVYATGHEGRGIGLVNKLRAYMLQDGGADTVSANTGLGLPVDARDFSVAAGVLLSMGIRSVRLLTNNPAKVTALRDAGLVVEEVVPLPVSPHARNARYLRTKAERLGHVAPTGSVDPGETLPGSTAIDPAALLGTPRPHPDRPHVIVKYAQTLDGRIATASGDSKWISGPEERRLSHGLRAACDAVLVGVGTVLADDPQLTVRMVPGASPTRVVLDSALRLPPDARILDGGAWTIVVTTERSDPLKRAALRSRGAAVLVVPAAEAGVDLPAALAALRHLGVETLLVEGGARVITSALGLGLADRLVVGVAPTLIGTGREAVGDLGVARVSDGIRLADRTVVRAGDDILIAGDVLLPSRDGG